MNWTKPLLRRKCLQQTVEALSTTPAVRDAGALAGKLAEARGIFKCKRYDCLGRPVCYPANAANAFVEAFPEAGATLDLCPTEEPEQREGWPPCRATTTCCAIARREMHRGNRLGVRAALVWRRAGGDI